MSEHVVCDAAGHKVRRIVAIACVLIGDQDFYGIVSFHCSKSLCLDGGSFDIPVGTVRGTPTT